VAGFAAPAWSLLLKALMNLDLALVLLMLAAAIAMFLVNRPRMDAVALLVMVAMPLTGIITMNKALAGFADPSIILIAALLVIGEGLVMTGIARRLGDWLDAKAGGSDNRLLILLMAAVCTENLIRVDDVTESPKLAE
jgi:di/tricarboxylate transporter